MKRFHKDQTLFVCVRMSLCLVLSTGHKSNVYEALFVGFVMKNYLLGCSECLRYRHKLGGGWGVSDDACVHYVIRRSTLCVVWVATD